MDVCYAKITINVRSVNLIFIIRLTINAENVQTNSSIVRDVQLNKDVLNVKIIHMLTISNAYHVVTLVLDVKNVLIKIFVLNVFQMHFICKIVFAFYVINLLNIAKHVKVNNFA